MIGNCLDILKEEHDLKSKDIAHFIGVCESTYSEWEHSKKQFQQED